MAKISTPALSPSMYRHFAVVTVAITLMLAIFSDGENRQAVASEIEAQQNAEAARLAASRPKYGTSRFKQKQRKENWNEFYESGGDFGDPTDLEGSRVQSVGALDLPVTSRLGEQFTPQDYARYGISQAELAAMSPAERERLLAKLRAGGLPIDPAERQRQIEQLVAASAERSGSAAGLE